MHIWLSSTARAIAWCVAHVASFCLKMVTSPEQHSQGLRRIVRGVIADQDNELDFQLLDVKSRPFALG